LCLGWRTLSLSVVLISTVSCVALHSYPTRRSSDLVGGAPAGHGQGVDSQPDDPAVEDLAAGDGLVVMRPGGTGLRHGSALVVRRDRKSTRLNSSHVSISYAVFCLKQK